MKLAMRSARSTMLRFPDTTSKVSTSPPKQRTHTTNTVAAIKSVLGIAISLLPLPLVHYGKSVSGNINNLQVVFQHIYGVRWRYSLAT